MTEWPYKATGIHYLDSAASTQKPKAVLDALQEFYSMHYSNVHRGLHRLAEESTKAYEKARATVAAFLGAHNPKEIVFTSGTTEAMNLLASTYPLTADDTVVVSLLDHHSTFVPWQQAAKRAGATFKVIPLADGRLDYAAAERLIEEGCAVLAITHLSNVTGETIDVSRLADKVHANGGVIFVDGAQAAAHIEIDVQSLGADAYCISAHKLYGPTGIGALYCRQDLLDTLPPYQFGGEMVDQVTVSKTTFANPPARFEAGTPPIIQSVGFSTAIDVLHAHQSDLKRIESLAKDAISRLSALPFITVHSVTEQNPGIISFTMEGVHAHDVAQFLDSKDVAVRAGHHCCQPLHDTFSIPASVRASFGLYNTKEDIDALIAALKECKEAFDV